MKSINGLDVRSIGLFRIFLGIVVFYNLLVFKWANFNDFFSIKSGFIPEPLLQTVAFKNIFTTDASVNLIFFLVSLSAIMLTIGYASRLNALLLFLFQAFYNSAFSHISFGYDRYLEVLLFLAILLPLEQRFAISSKSMVSKIDVEYKKWPAFLVLLQIGLIYTISGCSKNGIMWQNGTAVGALLLDDLLTLPIAVQLSSKTLLIKYLSYSTILFEAIALFLLFSPWKSQFFRIVFCCIIFSFHWGLSFFVDVGHFKWMGTLAVILILPAAFWLKFAKFETQLAYLEKGFGNWYRISKIQFFRKISNHKAVAIILFYLIIIGNVRMISVQGDAMGKCMQQLNLDKTFTSLTIKPLQSFGTVFNQNWYFYAPNPNIQLGKIYFIGVKYNGQQVNLENNLPFVPGDYVIRKNHSVLNRFFNTKLRNQVNKQKNPDMCLDYARYLVNTWEHEQKEHLMSMQAYNYYFNGRKIMDGEKKEIKMLNIISVDLDKMRKTN
jgi:hypothetical protein